MSNRNIPSPSGGLSRIQMLKGKFAETDSSKGSEAKPTLTQLHPVRQYKDRSLPGEIKTSVFDRSKLLSSRTDHGLPSGSKGATLPTSAKEPVSKSPRLSDRNTTQPSLNNEAKYGKARQQTRQEITLPTTSKEHSSRCIPDSKEQNGGNATHPEKTSKDVCLDEQKEKTRPVSKQQLIRSDQSNNTITESSTCEQNLTRDTATIVDELKSENAYLKDEIQALQAEMDEMQDQFKEEGEQDLIDLQKELETMSKNYRIAQFKLRKSERRVESIEAEKQQYEDRMRQLHDSADGDEDGGHVRELEQELQLSKEVSIRLHGEMEDLEEKCSKSEAENDRLIDELQQSEAKQHRMEKEIKRLQLALEDMRTVSGSPMVTIPPSAMQESPGSPSSLQVPEHQPAIGTIRQSSQEHEISQVLRDLYDSIEREQDMKEQLKFSEEEAKIVRRKLADLENENESLIAQLKKMSGKTPGRGYKRQTSKESARGKSSDDESESDLKLQLELAEQEMQVLRKKIKELSSENENFFDEVKFLQDKLRDSGSDDASHRSAADLEHYDAAMRVMADEIEELKWRLVEKDRELELARIINTKQSDGNEGVKRKASLTRSRSEEGEGQPGTGITIKQQLELLHEQAIVLKERNEYLQNENEQLNADNEHLKSIAPSDDDAKRKTELDSDESPQLLKAKIIDLEEEMSDLLIIINSREVENSSLEQQIDAYECELDDMKNTSEQIEKSYKEEIECFKSKNEVLSNCLQMLNQRTDVVQKHGEGEDAALTRTSNGEGGAPSSGKSWDDNFNKQLQSLKILLQGGQRDHGAATADTVDRCGINEEVLNTELNECISHLQDASEHINGIGDRLIKVVDVCEIRKASQTTSTPGKPENRLREQLQEEVDEVAKTCSKYKHSMEKLQAKIEKIIKLCSSLQLSWDKEKGRLMDEIHENVNLVRQAKQKILEKEGLIKARERQLEQSRKEIDLFKSQVSQGEQALVDEREALAHNAKLLGALDNEVKKLEGIVRNKNIELYEKDETCRLMREDCKVRDENIKQKADEMKALTKKLQTFEGKIISYVSQVGSLEQRLKQKDFEIGKHEKNIKSLKLNIDQLQSKYNGLNQDHLKAEQTWSSEETAYRKEVRELKDRCSTLNYELKKHKELLKQEKASWEKEEKALKLETVHLREEILSLERSGSLKSTEAVTIMKTEKQELLRVKTNLESDVKDLKRKLDQIEECNAYEKDELQSIIAEKAELIQEMQASEKQAQLQLADLRKKIEDQNNELQQTRSNLLERGDDDLRAMQSAQLKKLRQERSEMRKQFLAELEKHEDTKYDLSMLKSEYDRERDGWVFEKELMSRQVYEAKDKRVQVVTLQKMVENMKLKLQESENDKEELITMHSEDKLNWGIKISELQTKINKLEEQKPLPRFPLKAKEKRKSELENNWEKERFELRRIVAEAHALTIKQKEKLSSNDGGMQDAVEMRLQKEQEIHKRELAVHEAMARELHQRLNSLLGLKMELAETKTRFKREEAGWDLEKQNIQVTLEDARQRQKDTQHLMEQLVIKLKCIQNADPSKAVAEKTEATLNKEVPKTIKQVIADIENHKKQDKAIPVLKLTTRESKPLTKYTYGSQSTALNTKFPVYQPLKAPESIYNKPLRLPDTPPSLVFSRTTPSSTPSPRSSFTTNSGTVLKKSLSIDTPASTKLWQSFEDSRTPNSEKSSPVKNDEVTEPAPPGGGERPSTLPLNLKASTSATELRSQVEKSSKGDLTKPSPRTARKTFLDGFLSLHFGKKTNKSRIRPPGDTQSERGGSESPDPILKLSKSKSKKLLKKSQSLDESAASPSAGQVTPEPIREQKTSQRRSIFKRSSSLEASKTPDEKSTSTPVPLRRFSSEENLATSQPGKGKLSLFKKFKIGLKK